MIRLYIYSKVRRNNVSKYPQVLSVREPENELELHHNETFSLLDEPACYAITHREGIIYTTCTTPREASLRVRRKIVETNKAFVNSQIRFHIRLVKDDLARRHDCSMLQYFVMLLISV